jgi:hypothetical protein
MWARRSESDPFARSESDPPEGLIAGWLVGEKEDVHDHGLDDRYGYERSGSVV